MRERLLLVMGNSHVNCIANALKRKLYPSLADGLAIRVVAAGAAAFPGGLVVTGADGRRIANPVITRALAQAEADARRRDVWLLSVVGGNLAARMGLFRPAQSTYVALADEEVPADVEAEVFVPADALAATLRRQLASFDELLGLMPRTALKGFMHLEAPWPCADSDWMFEHLPAASRQLAAQMGLPALTAQDMAPPALRQRLWRAQSAVVREIVERHGGRYLTPPPAAADEAGFMRPGFCGDAVHGSIEYGRECLAMVAGLLQAAPAAPHTP